MKLKTALSLPLLILSFIESYAQLPPDAVVLAKIRNEGLNHSRAMEILGNLTDVYGQRLTGTREYYAAAGYIADQMKQSGLQNVHFENYCADCRGWGIKSFNVEMTAPNYMHISAYPLAMSKSTEGTVSGELVNIESFTDMDSVRQKFSGKIMGKVVLLGKGPKQKSLRDTLTFTYSAAQLKKMEAQLTSEVGQIPLPELLESWETSDKQDDEMLRFAQAEGAVAILTTKSMYLGVLHPQGTYYYREGDMKVLPYFTIMPEHFGRLYRMAQRKVTPVLRINLETEFYNEPENNVNIVAEIPGTDPRLKTETVLVGAHFDSWHSGTGATDNGANSVVLIEALRLLNRIGYSPKRTVKIGLWGGEEQAYLGSVAYAKAHFGSMTEKPNAEAEKVTAYLNLDNGAGAIRGLYLQKNEFARPVFEKIFAAFPNLTEGVLTIENTLSTDHETFDHYNIPAFQFIQDDLSYETVTHHTNLDVIEYVPEDDIKKNAVILAWTIYSLAERNEKVPRKK